MSETVELCASCLYLLTKGLGHPITGAILCPECQKNLENAIRRLEKKEEGDVHEG